MCFCELLDSKELEMTEKRKEEGGNMQDLGSDIPQDSQDKDRPASYSKSAGKCSDSNARAPSIYREVAYMNTTDEERKLNSIVCQCKKAANAKVML